MDLWLLDDLINASEYQSFLLYIFIYMLAQYVMLVFYLRSMYQLLRAIKTENRYMNPGLVWLGLIPWFNLIWPFIMHPLVCLSIKKDLETSGLDEYGDYGMVMGIVFPLLAFGEFVPYVGRFVIFAGFIVWFLFWLKMNDYRRKIIAADGLQGREDILDF